MWLSPRSQYSTHGHRDHRSALNQVRVELGGQWICIRPSKRRAIHASPRPSRGRRISSLNDSMRLAIYVTRSRAVATNKFARSALGWKVFPPRTILVGSDSLSRTSVVSTCDWRRGEGLGRQCDDEGDEIARSRRDYGLRQDHETSKGADKRAGFIRFRTRRHRSSFYGTRTFCCRKRSGISVCLFLRSGYQLPWLLPLRR